MGGIIGPKVGIFRLLIAANGIAIFSNLIKVIETSTTIFVGRFMFSVCTGLGNFCMSKAISETVPNKFEQRYGIFYNSGLQFGILLTSIFGVFLPRIEDKQALKSDQVWRIIWLIPIAMESIALILIPIFYKHLSLKDLIQNDNQADLAASELQKTYVLSTEASSEDASNLILILKSQSISTKNIVTLRESLSSVQHRRSSWNSVILAYLH